MHIYCWLPDSRESITDVYCWSSFRPMIVTSRAPIVRLTCVIPTHESSNSRTVAILLSETHGSQDDHRDPNIREQY